MRRVGCHRCGAGGLGGLAHTAAAGQRTREHCRKQRLQIGLACQPHVKQFELPSGSEE